MQWTGLIRANSSGSLWFSFLQRCPLCKKWRIKAFLHAKRTRNPKSLLLGAHAPPSRVSVQSTQRGWKNSIFYFMHTAAWIELAGEHAGDLFCAIPMGNHSLDQPAWRILAAIQRADWRLLKRNWSYATRVVYGSSAYCALTKALGDSSRLKKYAILLQTGKIYTHGWFERRNIYIT